MKKILLILILLFMSYQLQTTSYAEGVADMKKVVLIIPQENFRDEELFEPKRILEKTGIIVKVASRTQKQASGMLGAKFMPDMALQDINVQDFDAVVFVGGQGAVTYWDDPVAQRVARDAYSANKIIAAICVSPVILARAGLLKSKRATVSPSVVEELTSEGATYTAKAVEKDGNIITASGPRASTEFGNQLLKVLSETQTYGTK